MTNLDTENQSPSEDRSSDWWAGYHAAMLEVIHECLEAEHAFMKAYEEEPFGLFGRVKSVHQRLQGGAFAIDALVSTLCDRAMNAFEKVLGKP